MENGTNPVGWFEIYVQDVARAKTFYETTFGVTFQSLESPGLEMWGFPMDWQKTGASGALVKMDGKDSGGGGTIVYFPVEDCEAKAKDAAANGGRIQLPRKSIGQYGFISLVYDTEGNLIGLHSMK